MLNKRLIEYIQNPNLARANFKLGQEYELIGQTGAAISFYLRTAERSETDLEQYEALLRMALCFERQRTRDDTEKVLLQKAISLLTKRPEAYFILSRLHEVKKEWHDAYTVASIGLNACDFDLPPLSTDVEYPGYYGLLFEKGVAAWWVGQTEQAREIMHDLKFSHRMTATFTAAVDRNLGSIGWPNTRSEYNPNSRDRARVQFPGLDNITKNHAQSYQDLFVLSATNGKRNGRYLEIGCAEPFKNNNTALLETQFDWTGVSLDINQTVVTEFMDQRNNLVFCLDATKVDYAKFLTTLGYAGDMDYLQIDCDPPARSFEILKRIPFDQYRFSCITFEHDYYVDVDVRDRSRQYLLSKGYVLVAGDIAYNRTHSYEDWWIHPDLVDADIQKTLMDPNTGLKFAGDYMFPDLKEPAPVATITSAPSIMKTRPFERSQSDLINTEYMPGFWIVDNFYRDPDAVRAFALEQEYEPSGPGKPYIGSRTYKQFLFPGLQEEFEYIMGRKIEAWESHGMNGRFQFNVEGEPLVYHADLQRWAAMLYLTPNAPYETGTMTHALKGTDIRHSSHPEFGRCFRPGSRNLDKTPFEDVDIIGNVYNRLVIFNAGYLHSACGYFGWNQQNSRLWQMFFFD
jgi:tetratricopeptide (TPR) repeat protein